MVTLHKVFYTLKAIEQSTSELLLPDKLKPSEIIIHTCLIRAAISIMSNRGRLDYTEIINSLLNDNDLKIKNEQKEYILRIINDYSIDRRKIKIISLGIKLN